MTCNPPISIVLTEILDVVETALATLSRRLPASVSREDLASVGKLALVESLGRCRGAEDEVRAYCFVRVRGAMLDELRRLDPRSRRERERLNMVRQARAALAARLGRTPSTVEIAQAADLTVAEVMAAQTGLEQDSWPAYEDLAAIPDTEALSPAEVVEQEDLRAGMQAALARLTPTQAIVLRRYYLEEATLDEIAADFGVSKERVRQIREVGAARLRADYAVLSLWQALFGRARDGPTARCG